MNWISKFIDKRIEEESKIFDSEYSVDWEFFIFLMICVIIGIIIGGLL